MAFFKRAFFFVALNVLVMVMLTIIVQVFGLDRALYARGLDYRSLMIFCLVWGMGGAFISLAISRFMAKMAMGVQVINPDTASGDERRLVDTVHHLAREAGLTVMPEVGYYESPEVNAFATGPTRNRALVAVSTGLLQKMQSNEVEAVLGHEIGHVANGDMVTMTLVQGIVNAFVMFLARILAYIIATAMSGDRRRERDSGGAPNFLVFFLVEMALQVVLMIPATMIVCWVSRWREYRADRAGAKLAGKQNMINALQALRRTVEGVDETKAPALQTLKINGHGTGLLRFFMSHPPLEARIKRLQETPEAELNLD